MNQGKFFIGILLAAVIGAAVALGAQHYLLGTPATTPLVVTQNEDAVALRDFLADSGVVVPRGLNFVVAANEVKRTVVHITTAGGGGRNPASMLQDLLGRGHPDELRESSGSGVILTADGYIVTNHHVIDEAGQINVVLEDKRRYPAELIGSDPTTDLALLKIDAQQLPYVQYGDSDKLQIGEWVLAVGNPFDLTSTVTAGIVSAKGRNINILRTRNNQFAIESFIQTDAAVNPGNSGGALVNLNGELIGINTAIATNTGMYAGYSFAVPAALVRKVTEDLLNFGKVQRALLGVSISDMTSERAAELGIEGVRGVYIERVNAESAAAGADLREGDILLQIDGRSVNSTSELQEVVARYHPGDEIDVVYLRDSEQRRANAVLQGIEDTEFAVPVRRAVLKVPELGASLQQVSVPELNELDLDGGVKVVALSDGKLKSAGMREGFVITAIDKEPINTPEEVAVRVTMRIAEQGGGLLIEGVYPDGTKDYFGIGWQ
ncbi:MAG: trypsin-like peptidase domain-containing protein [Catalinimonas sp.]